MIQYGSYISVAKFIVFLVCFFVWLPIVAWVFRDARMVRTREVLWSGIVFATGAAATLVWLLTPVFAVGFALYLIAVGATCMAYTMHRNARVAEFERVLTVNHFRSIFSNERKKVAVTSRRLAFITANKNEIEPPPRKTAEFYGYKFANEIFDDAILWRASDISFMPSQQEYTVLYQIDGLAFKQPARGRQQMEYFIRFIKQLADVDPDEKRKPQRGFFTIKKNSASINWEVNTAGSTTGERIRIRRVEEHNLIKLKDIGLSPEQVEQLSKIRDSKGGVFLVSGPEKTGITTTLYALLKNHDPFMFSINTLERQPIAELMNITQNTYSLSDTGTTTFARRLQTILRTDPDIVGVDNCQDSETARLACSGAGKGKLLYVTLQAANVVQALSRWMKWVGDKNLVADTLLGISNQRLLRNICEKCKEAYQPNRELLKKFNIPADKVKLFYRPAETQYTRRGKPIVCQNCHGIGYVGRTAVFETIVMNKELRDAIRKSDSLADIATQFRRAKMLYMQEQAIRKVIHGTTSINEVIREFSAGKKKQKPKQKKKKK